MATELRPVSNAHQAFRRTGFRGPASCPRFLPTCRPPAVIRSGSESEHAHATTARRVIVPGRAHVAQQFGRSKSPHHHRQPHEPDHRKDRTGHDHASVRALTRPLTPLPQRGSFRAENGAKTPILVSQNRRFRVPDPSRGPARCKKSPRIRALPNESRGDCGSTPEAEETTSPDENSFSPGLFCGLFQELNWARKHKPISRARNGLSSTPFRIFLFSSTAIAAKVPATPSGVKNRRVGPAIKIQMPKKRMSREPQQSHCRVTTHATYSYSSLLRLQRSGRQWRGSVDRHRV